MKIIRPYPRRRKGVVDHPSNPADLLATVQEQPSDSTFGADASRRAPVRRALLIGIRYASGEACGRAEVKPGELRGPHNDVLSMRQLLIDTYEYKPEDIVALLDATDYVQPTRVNILREIKRLIDGALPGDTFFFHYCGHVGQIPNRTNSEEDGMDECLVPSDASDSRSWILDNELKRSLVDPLPVGSNLIAVFDSCHSESLLDLYHSKCNRVWVPWTSKGRRRSNSLMNRQVRHFAVDEKVVEGLEGNAVVATRRVYQSNRISSGRVISRRTSIDHLRRTTSKGAILPVHSRRSPPTSISARLSINVDSLDVKSEFAPIHTHEKASAPPDEVPNRSLIRRSSTQETWVLSPDNMRCDSPLGAYCTGSCRPGESEGNDLANVISIGACKDEQLAWEDDDGASMTTALIDVLKSSPNPTYRSLMISLSHRLHELSMHVHEANRQYKAKLREWKKKQVAKGRAISRSASDGAQVALEIDNFQDPQLSSHTPLDMNTRFRP